MKRIDALIAPFVKEFRMEEAVRFEGIKREWGDIFREPLSLHMSPVSLKSGELLINVDSPLWLQQISFLKTQIIDKLSALGVKDVRFRVGRVVSARKNEPVSAQVSTSPLEKDAVQQIENTVAGVNDAIIKESIRKAMGRSFAAKKARPQH